MLSLREAKRRDTPSEPLACLHGDVHTPADAVCSPVGAHSVGRSGGSVLTARNDAVAVRAARLCDRRRAC